MKKRAGYFFVKLGNFVGGIAIDVSEDLSGSLTHSLMAWTYD